MTDDLSAELSRLLSEAISPVLSDNAELQESLDMAMLSLRMEDRGWQLLFGGGKNLEGLELDDLKDISARMREKVAAGALYGRGVSIHTGYVFGRGINIPGIERPQGSGSPTALRRFYIKNYENLFSPSAQGELQKCRYTDGNIFALCQPNQPVRFIPLKEIEDIIVNPDFPSEIWAYLRSWTPDSNKPTEQRYEWYYTKRYEGPRKQSIKNQAGENIKVGAGVVVDKGFNKQIGWPLGIPDVAPAAPWIEAYNEIMQYGRVVNEALSKILFKIISPTKKGAANAAARIAAMQGHGNTASSVEGSEVQAISTAGKGYDFSTARPVAAEAASALNVQLMELLSDTSAAGSSYGSAAALVPSVQNAMVFMQKQWQEFYSEIFDAYSIPVPEMSFDSITEPDFYRQMQGITLAAAALSDEEYRAEVLDAMNIEGDAKTIPPILKARSAAAASAGVQQASPTQGQNNPAGSSGSASNDIRTDNISEVLAAGRLDELRELVERLERVMA